LPMTGLRLKLNFLAHSIVELIVFVDNATVLLLLKEDYPK
jgi:hypothetical protein